MVYYRRLMKVPNASQGRMSSMLLRSDGELDSFPVLRRLTLVAIAIFLLILILDIYRNRDRPSADIRGSRNNIRYNQPQPLDYINSEQAAYHSNSKIDRAEVDNHEKQRLTRESLTADPLRVGLKVNRSRFLRRLRRDSLAENEEYGEHASNNEPNISHRKTITIVSSNKISDDDFELAIAGRKLEQEHTTQKQSDFQNHDGTFHSSESQTDMDVIFATTRENCDRRLATNRTNTTDHENSNTTHAGGHEKCTTELESGVPALYIVFYIFMILFLFVGLAIICDDFFISSLEAISKKLNLSEDVAGATFMAAGSSAPELFISIAGAGAGSDVGVGTIVGSAVFNLLIIIALTACLAGKELCLDWRPFIRDAIFYAFSIIAFILFSLDTQFKIWESLVLLLLYALYILIMKFNAQLMECMASMNCCFSVGARIAPQDMQKPSDTMETAAPDSSVKPTPAPPVAQNPFSPSSTTTPKKPMKVCESVAPPVTKSKKESDSKTPSPNVRNLDVPTVSSESSPSTSGQSPGKTLPPITPKIAFQSPEKTAVKVASPTKQIVSSDPVVQCACTSVNAREDPATCSCCVIHISNQPCRYCSNVRDMRSPVPLIRCSSCSSIVGKNMLTSGPAKSAGNESDLQLMSADLPNSVGVKRSASMITMQSGKGLPKFANSNASNNRDAKDSESNKAPPIQHDTIQGHGEVELKDAVDGAAPLVVIFPCFPGVANPKPQKPVSSECLPAVKYILRYILYLLSFPWACVFTWTVPKCDTPPKRKWYMASFFLCIGWIALLSWFMIELVERIGCLLNIDSYTMGLIVVAVGTSVPDAISSVLVAKEGCGDMAVSNAVGSNVFDINLGLGLPFFLGSIITSKPISLMTPMQMCLLETLPLPVRIVPHVKFGIILLVVLIIAVGTFILVKFRLTKRVSIIFVTMYIAFMIYAFVQEKKCYSFFC